MIICEHDETEKEGNVQFTVIFEGPEEVDFLEGMIRAKAAYDIKLTNEQALNSLIRIGVAHIHDI